MMRLRIEGASTGLNKKNATMNDSSPAASNRPLSEMDSLQITVMSSAATPDYKPSFCLNLALPMTR